MASGGEDIWGFTLGVQELVTSGTAGGIGRGPIVLGELDVVRSRHCAVWEFGQSHCTKETECSCI